MQHDPVLASIILPADPEQGQKHPHTFRVEGGLHYIRGNSSPHFSLTYTEHRQGFPNQDYGGGCNPELILQHFPRFADLAALHLSDIAGAPMHAEANGWHDLAGALGGFGEEYHAGSSKQNFPLPASRLDPAAPWRTTEHRLPTREECLQMFARHCRIGIEEARAIMADIDRLNHRLNDFTKFTREELETRNPGYLANCRARWRAICESMRPRWKQEADACILRHGLTLYGDPWDGDRPPGLRRAGEAMPRTCHDLLPGDTSTPPPASPEQTYIDQWGITSTATQTDRNPNLHDSSGDMTHWRVTLKHGKRKMTVYFSMGSAHTGREPTAQEVIDCIVQDSAYLDGTFENWAGDLGFDPDSRAAHRTYTICKRQTERLQKFLGAEHYAELTGGE